MPTFDFFLLRYCMHSAFGRYRLYSTNKTCKKPLIIYHNKLNSLKMATKATTIKEAIKRWEEKTGQHANQATEVSLTFQWPPIEKMDNTLACLVNCE